MNFHSRNWAGGWSFHNGVIYEIFERIRKEQLVEVVAMAGGIHRIVATSKGQAEAHNIMARDMYAGPAQFLLRLTSKWFAPKV